MTLSGPEIRDELENGELTVDRQEGEGVSVEPSSIDFHLGSEYLIEIEQDNVVNVWNEDSYPNYEYKKRNYMKIEPGEFLLAHTDEYVRLPPEYVGYLQGRSSVGRLGLFVENAGLVDTGFEGQLTLELFNSSKNPIRVQSGMRICQLTIHEHNEEPDVAYSSENGNKYNHQTGPTASRLFEDFKE